MSSLSRRKVVTQPTEGGCRHLVDQRGVVVTKSTRDSQQVDQRELSSPSRQGGDCCHQVNKRSSHSRPKGLSSPSRQEVVTQSTKGVVVTKSTEGRHAVDQWGCRHQVGKKGMSSPSRQEVVTQSTEGAETPSQPKERGHQVNPRSGDTKSTHGEREGTPSQPTEKGRGHQVNPRRKGGDTKSTHRKVAGRIN